MLETPKERYDTVQENINAVRATATPKLMDFLNKLVLYAKDLSLIINENPQHENSYLQLGNEILEMARDNPDSLAITGTMPKLSNKGKEMVKKGNKMIRDGKGMAEDGLTLVIEDRLARVRAIVNKVHGIDGL